MFEIKSAYYYSIKIHISTDKVCMYEEMMTNDDNVESSLLTSIY